MTSAVRNRKDPKLPFFGPEPLSLPGPSPVESHILDAARRGLLQYRSKISMNDVAQLAGISRGTVYKYFLDRDSLIDAVVEAALIMMLAEVEHVMASEHSFEDAAAAAAVVFRQWHKAERGAHFVTSSDEARVMTIQSASFIVPTIQLFRTHLEQAKMQGEFRADLDLDAAAEWVARVIYSLLTFPAYTFNIDSASGVRAFVREYIVRGLR